MQFFEDKDGEREFLEKQILQIEDFNVRKEAKEIVSNVLMPFYEELQSAYQSLDEWIAKERMGAEAYEIITAIKPRKEVDETDNFLHPMREEDMKERTIFVEDVWEKLRQNEGYELFQIYVEDSYEKVFELLHTKCFFPVEITTEYGTYTGKAVLEEVKEYEEILLQLYEDFVENGIEWKTINAPYLHKLLKVLLVEADCPQDEEILNVKVDFGAYQDIFRCDYVPLWNLRKLHVNTSAYPKQSLNGAFFEHIIQDEAVRAQNAYLVHRADKVYGIRNDAETKEFAILCKERKPAEWILWEFSKASEREDNSHWMRNGNARKQRGIRTQAEAVRFAEGLMSNAYVSLLAVSTEAFENGKEIRTYSMDDFLPEEIRNQKDAPKLYFLCSQKQRENYLNQDMMSFMLSRFQLLYPEYQCVACIRE